MLTMEASPAAMEARALALRNERRVITFAIKKELRVYLLFLKTRETHEESDHAADASFISRQIERRLRDRYSGIIRIEKIHGGLAIEAEVGWTFTRV
jgi:hypothetical protein